MSTLRKGGTPARAGVPRARFSWGAPRSDRKDLAQRGLLASLFAGEAGRELLADPVSSS